MSATVAELKNVITGQDTQWQQVVERTEVSLHSLHALSAKVTNGIASTFQVAGASITQPIQNINATMGRTTAAVSAQMGDMGNAASAASAKIAANNTTIQNYSAELASARVQLAQLNQKIIEATKEHGREGEEVVKLRSQYTELAASARIISAQKTELATKNKALADSYKQTVAASKSLSEVEQAFKTLGVTSQASLQDTANKARASYSTILTSGTATARELEQAWAASQKAIARAADTESKKVARDWQAIGDKINKAGAGLSNIGRDLTIGVTAPILGAGIAALKMSTDFNAAMANVATLLPQGSAQAAGFKVAIQDMAIAMGKSTKDLAGGLYEVVSSIGPVDDALKILEINAKAGAAGLSTTQEALKFTAAVTKTYGDISAEAFQKVSDLGFQAVNLGQTTFPELAASIGGVAPLAKQTGVSLEEMFAIIATATGVTGNTSEVVTQMASAISGLVSPNKALTEVYKSLGVKSGEALIQQKGLVVALQLVSAAAEKSGKPLLDLIGRKEAWILAASLAGSQATTFTEKLQAMGNVAGTTDKAFQEQTQGLNKLGFAWEQAKVKMEVMLQRLGDALGPIALQAAVAFEPLIGKLQSAVDWFTKLPESTQKTIAVIAGVAAAIGPALLVVGHLATAFSSISAVVGPLVASVGGLSGALAIMTGPVGLAVAAIAAIGTGMVIAYKQSEEFRGVIHSVAGFIGDSFKTMSQAVSSFASAAWPVLVGLWSEYKETVVKALQPVAQVWNEHKDLILKILGAVAIGLTGPIGAVVLFATKFKTSLDHVKDVLSNFAPFFKQVWQNALTAVEAVWGTISNVVAAGVKLVSSIVKIGQGDWAGAWGDYKSAAGFAWDAITALIKGSAELTLGILNAAWLAIKGAAATVWDGLKVLIQASWTAISTFLTERVPFMLGQLATWFSELPKNLPGYMSRAYEAIKSAVATGGVRVIQVTQEWLGKMPGLIDDMAGAMIKKVASLAEDLPQKFLILGLKAYGKFKEGMDAKSPTGPEKLITQMAKGMGVTLDEAIPKLSDKAQKLGDSIAKHINAGLKSIGFEGDLDISEILNFSAAWRKAADEIGDKARQLAETKRQVGLVIAFSYDTARKALDEFLRKVKEQTPQIVKELHVVGLKFGELPNIVTASATELLAALQAQADGLANWGRLMTKIANDRIQHAKDVAKEEQRIIKESFDNLASVAGPGISKFVKAVLDGMGQLNSKTAKATTEWVTDVVEIVGLLPGGIGRQLNKVIDEFNRWYLLIDKVIRLIEKSLGESETEGIGGAIAGLSKAIGGIFGKAQKETKASAEVWAEQVAGVMGSMGDEAGKAGGESGKAFEGEFMAKVAAIAGGLATFFGSRGKGKAAGVLGGAMAGMQIGAAFGGGVGALIGAGAGALFGLFKTGPSEEEKRRQEEERKRLVEEARLSLAKTYEDLKQAMLTTARDFIKFVDEMAGSAQIPKDVLNKFVANMTRTLSKLADAMKSIAPKITDEVKRASETLLPAVDLMSRMPLAFEAINGHFGIADTQIDLYFSSLDKVADKIGASAERTPGKLEKNIKKYSERLLPSIDLMKGVGELIKMMFETKDAPDPKAFDIWESVIGQIITRVGRLSDNFDKFWIKTMAAFAEKAKSGLSFWKEATDAVRATKDVPSVSQADVDNVIGSIELFLTGLVKKLSSLATDELNRIASMATGISSIASALKNWAETSAVIRDYTAISAQVWDDIVTDFKKALALLHLLIADAMLFVDEARIFDSLMTEGGGFVESGFKKFADAINTSSSLLNGTLSNLNAMTTFDSNLQSLGIAGGALGDGLSISHSFANAPDSNSLSPSAFTPSSNQFISSPSSAPNNARGGDVHIHLTVHGSVVTNTELKRFIIEAGRELQRKGGGSIRFAT